MLVDIFFILRIVILAFLIIFFVSNEYVNSNHFRIKSQDTKWIKNERFGWVEEFCSWLSVSGWP